MQTLDVAGFAKLAKTLDPNAAVLKLANPAPSQAVDWPYAPPENIPTVLHETEPLSDASLIVPIRTLSKNYVRR